MRFVTMATLSLNSKPKPGHGLMAQHRKYGLPYIQWKHPDGPMLVCRNGVLHWLTYWERICYKFGWTDIVLLNFKYEGK